MSDLMHAWTLGLARGGGGGQPVNAVGVPGAAPASNGGTTGAGTTTPPGAPGGTTTPARGPDMIFWLLPAMLVVMVLMSVFSGRKEKKRQAELLAAIKKGDKVQTLGGIIGTIAEIGDHDVVLRLEDGRMRMAKSAVQRVLTSSGISGSSLEAKPESAKAAV